MNLPAEARRASVDFLRLAKMYGTDCTLNDEDEDELEEEEMGGTQKARHGSGVPIPIERERRGALGAKGMTIKTERKTPSQTVRGIVSKNKIRFQEDGFDLDLTYITPRLVAMGFPSSGTEGYYRNQIDDVEKFFTTRHTGHFRVYNLCSERTYDTNARFGGHHVRFPFDDHNPPVPISLIPSFVEDAITWLDEHTSNVIAVHCKAGKGRTGMMLGALLLSQAAENNSYMSAQEALQIFGKARTHDGKGVTIPSQIRYLGYWEKILNNNGGQLPPHRKFTLDYLRIFALKDKIDLYFTVTLGEKDNKKEIYDSRRDFSSKSAHRDTGYHFDLTSSHINVVCSGDVLYKVKKSKVIGSDETLFMFWVNLDVEGWDTNNMKVCLVKDEIDKAVKDKSNDLYKRELSVELSFFEYVAGSPSVSALRGMCVSPVYSPLRGPMSPHKAPVSPSVNALPGRYSPAKTPLVLSPAAGPSSLLSPPGSPEETFSIDFSFPSQHAPRKRGASGREVTGYLRISRLRAAGIVLGDDSFSDQVRCKITVGTFTQQTELTTIVNSTAMWRVPSSFQPFRISRDTFPTIELEVVDSTHGSVGTATVHLLEMLPPFPEWGSSSSIRVLSDMWKSGASLEGGDGEGTVQLQGMFDLTNKMKAFALLPYCVTALAAAIASESCEDSLLTYANTVSNTALGILVDSPSGSPLSSLTGSPLLPSRESSPRKERHVQLLRALEKSDFSPPQAYLGTFQHRRDGIRKVDTFMLLKEQFIRYEEKDKVDLTLLDDRPTPNGEYGIKLDGYEVRCRTTPERNKWLQLFASLEDDLSETTAECARLALEEQSERSLIDAEAAWGYSGLLRHHLTSLLEQSQNESASLAAHARRLQNSQRKLELEKRKMKQQAEQMRLETLEMNALNARRNSRSGSEMTSSSPLPHLYDSAKPTSPLLSGSTYTNGSPMSDGQKSPPSGDYGSELSEPGTPMTPMSAGKSFRRVRLSDTGCQTTFEDTGFHSAAEEQQYTGSDFSSIHDLRVLLVNNFVANKEVVQCVLTVAAACAGVACATLIDARCIIVFEAEDSSRLDAWERKREEVARNWPILVRTEEVHQESERALRERLTRTLVSTIMMMRRHQKVTLMRKWMHRWELWRRVRTVPKLAPASLTFPAGFIGGVGTPLSSPQRTSTSPQPHNQPFRSRASPSKSFEPSLFPSVPSPLRSPKNPNSCTCLPFQRPPASPRGKGFCTRCSKCWRNIEL
eukprot:TRINITY_DN9612_c0_g2_i1.p1 TRINITY_DN9612_c0_g2~~TRINITY_DN9612_c0_g2_i1.p1  ORF type:complete len:1237 (+),score=229.61 TRINITY_DN9612_c0_g2_i1:134-3844(+)